MHSQSETLHISVHYKPSSFQLTIGDEGIGFDYYLEINRLIKKGNGFQQMGTAARMINAKLDIQSHIGQGTCISLYLATLSI
jgi:signal transduction histidine kinase